MGDSREQRQAGVRGSEYSAGTSGGRLGKSEKADGRTGSGTRGRWGGRPAAGAGQGAAAEQGGHGDENEQSKAGADGWGLLHTPLP